MINKKLKQELEDAKSMEGAFQTEIKELRKELMKAVMILHSHGGNFSSNMVGSPP